VRAQRLWKLPLAECPTSLHLRKRSACHEARTSHPYGGSRQAEAATNRGILCTTCLLTKKAAEIHKARFQDMHSQRVHSAERSGAMWRSRNSLASSASVVTAASAFCTRLLFEPIPVTLQGAVYWRTLVSACCYAASLKVRRLPLSGSLPRSEPTSDR
jgi:hypothetical protein